MTEPCHISVDEQDEEGVIVICFRNPILDTVLETALEPELTDVLRNHPSPKIVLDFSAVVHCTSAIISVFLRFRKQVKQTNGQLIMCSMSPSVREVFVVTRLEHMFTIVETRSEAMARFGH